MTWQLPRYMFSGQYERIFFVHNSTQMVHKCEKMKTSTTVGDGIFL